MVYFRSQHNLREVLAVRKDDPTVSSAIGVVGCTGGTVSGDLFDGKEL